MPLLVAVIALDVGLRTLLATAPFSRGEGNVVGVLLGLLFEGTTVSLLVEATDEIVGFEGLREQRGGRGNRGEVRIVGCGEGTEDNGGEIVIARIGTHANQVCAKGLELFQPATQIHTPPQSSRL